MEIIKHRVNVITQIDNKYGLEIDVRDSIGELVISHDSSSGNEITLNNYLKHTDSKKLIAINIKSSEIENKLKQILQTNNITNYFTFDWSVPSLIKAIQIQLICAFRLSEYEKEIIPNCSWAWLDAFHSIWYDETLLDSLKNKGLKIAIVSPELHNRKSELPKVKEIVKSGKVDAICTDLPEYYQ